MIDMNCEIGIEKGIVSSIFSFRTRFRRKTINKITEQYSVIYVINSAITVF